MADDAVTVIPADLAVAAQLLAGQAEALRARRSAGGSAEESAALAAAGLSRALDGYRRTFAQTLSAVSAALIKAADDYTAMEADNAGALNTGVAPGYR